MPKRILEVRHHEYDCVSTLSFKFIEDTMLAYTLGSWYFLCGPKASLLNFQKYGLPLPGSIGGLYKHGTSTVRIYSKPFLHY